MTKQWDISERVVRGELRNNIRNRIGGWLSFGGNEGVFLEVVGNFEDSLKGKVVLVRSQVPDVNVPNSHIEDLDLRQIGVIGVVECRDKDGNRIAFQNDVTCDFYLEWFSQDGHVLGMMRDARIEIYDYQTDAEKSKLIAPPDQSTLDASQRTYMFNDPLPTNTDEQLDDAAKEPLTTNESDVDELGNSDLEDDIDLELPEDADDIYNEAIDDDFDAVDFDEESSEDIPFDDEFENEDFQQDGTPRKRNWEEVIPGIDPATKAMYESWDEILEGDHNVELSELFDPPLHLKPVDAVTDEAEATQIMRTLLARLAEISVAIDVCEHFTMLQTYRWFLKEILPEMTVHPNLASSGFVQHYSTFESCSDCEQEFQQEYNNDGAE